MPRATWKGAVLAEATNDKVRIVEGNVYFPPDSVHWEHFQPSEKITTCPWKGSANYHHIAVAGDVNSDAAWTYVTPKEAAKEIAGYIAFWRGVQVEK